MADQIKEAYQSSKNIYDNVLTQRNFLADYMQMYFGAERTIMKSHIKFFHTYRMILMEQF